VGKKGEFSSGRLCNLEKRGISLVPISSQKGGGGNRCPKIGRGT